jgi:hypothetical protein
VWTALLAFAGGVAAVALKGYVDYALERRRDRKDVEVAARLVYEELWTAAAEIDAQLFMLRVPSPEHFVSDVWTDNKKLLAREMDFEMWRLLVFGYDAVETARMLSEEHFEDTASPELTSEKLRADLIDTNRTITTAMSTVSDLIADADFDPFPVPSAADFPRESPRRTRWRRRRARLRRLVDRSRRD